MLLLKVYTERIEDQQKTTILCWIPRHSSIPGNEAASKAAKQALDRSITEIGIHSEDYKLHIRNYINWLWQREWDDCTENRLHKVQIFFFPGHLCA